MILIIGNSPHLSEAISLAYPGHDITIVSWRSDFHHVPQIQADLIFIVGFDYASYMKRYEDFLDVNVEQPMFALQRFAKPSADRVYVATQNGPKNYTFSRYRYAKEKLGLELVSQSANSYVVRFDTFATLHQEPLVKGGAVTKWIFSRLAKLGVVKTVDMHTVSERLKNYQNSCSGDIREITGRLLFLPRPQFIDRLMRLLFG